VNKIDHLIISSTIDYSTDLVCYEFEQRKEKYLRINRDDFLNYNILYDVSVGGLTISIGDTKYFIDSSLKSVFFRAPVFIRSNKKYDINEQLYRSQWSSFIRNLIVFENSMWVNNPVDTYKAENKLYQLHIAKKTGLDIPKSYIGNCISDFVVDKNNYIVKSLDTALFYEGNQEMFTYSNVISGTELKQSSIQYAPIILQECIQNKIDIRVTVIGNKVFPVTIKNNNSGIEGDWRKMDKDNLSYEPINLPDSIIEKILLLMKELRLKFGGIDLMLSDNKYYFVEVNPTGEWGWLVRTAKLPLQKEIVNLLTGGQNV